MNPKLTPEQADALITWIEDNARPAEYRDDNPDWEMSVETAELIDFIKSMTEPAECHECIPGTELKPSQAHKYVCYPIGQRPDEVDAVLSKIHKRNSDGSSFEK